MDPFDVPFDQPVRKVTSVNVKSSPPPSIGEKDKLNRRARFQELLASVWSIVMWLPNVSWQLIRHLGFLTGLAIVVTVSIPGLFHSVSRRDLHSYSPMLHHFIYPEHIASMPQLTGPVQDAQRFLQVYSRQKAFTSESDLQSLVSNLSENAGQLISKSRGFVDCVNSGTDEWHRKRGQDKRLCSLYDRFLKCNTKLAGINRSSERYLNEWHSLVVSVVQKSSTIMAWEKTRAEGSIPGTFEELMITIGLDVFKPQTEADRQNGLAAKTAQGQYEAFIVETEKLAIFNANFSDYPKAVTDAYHVLLNVFEGYGEGSGMESGHAQAGSVMSCGSASLDPAMMQDSIKSFVAVVATVGK